MTTADWAPAGSFTTVGSIPGSYTTGTTSDGATIVTSGPYAGYTQTGHAQTEFGYVLTWESPVMMPTPAGAALSQSTGVSPAETSYALYGHIIPLLVLGRGRVGGDIISGPWHDGDVVSGINSFGVQADPTRVLTLTEVAFDSEVVWTGSQVGDGALSSSGFSSEPITMRFYTGSLTQSADSLETSHFGSDAVAYRGQVLLAIENMPLANTKFKKYPYIAAKFVDQDGAAVNFGDLFERLAYGPYVGYTSAEFETVGITDGVADGGFIIAQDMDFLTLIQQFGRFYPTWDILQTDKLRIVDRGSNVTPDIVLNRQTLMGDLVVSRRGADTVKKDLELSTIDPDSDYTVIMSRAQRPRDPVAVTTSVGVDSAYLPVIMDASTRQAIVTLAKYHEEQTRKTISGTAMAYGLEMEPGDLDAVTGIGANFENEIYKVKETLHGVNNVVEFTAEAFLKCEVTIDDAGDVVSPDPYFAYVKLLLGFNGANHSSGSPGFTDESGAAHGTATVVGSQLDTGVSAFGASSAALGGDVSFSNSADWNLGSSSFTFESRIRVTTVSGIHFLFARWQSPNNEFTFYQNGAALEFHVSTTGANDIAVITSGSVLSTNTWHAFCVDYDGSKYRMYLNGTMIGSSSTPRAMFGGSSQPLYIGRLTPSSLYPWSGWADEMRLTVGVARYASDGGYTIATSAFPRN